MPVSLYQNYLEINPIFESVVDLKADGRNPHLWREYIVGDDMEKLVNCLCQSLGNEAVDARRSFWIHGSYGTGKSYAALVVKHLLEEEPDTIRRFLSDNKRLSQYCNRFMKCRQKEDYLVIYQEGFHGIRTGSMMLMEMEATIRKALIEKFGKEKAYLGTAALTDAIKARIDDDSINWQYLIETTDIGNESGSLEKLRRKIHANDLSAIQTAAKVLQERGIALTTTLETFKAWIADVIDGNGLSRSGIFYIWDEFSEYITNSDEHVILQQISEFSKESPLFMMYVVHKSNDMIRDIGGQDKYQQIIHRFHEVEFHVTPDAALDLIAGSISIRNGMGEKWKDERKAVVKRIQPFLADMTTGPEDRIPDMIGDLCPIHPMTIRLLSRVAESFAAAQRTMFRFMKDQSDTQIGFVGYIHQYGPDDQACWLTPDWLWDYFFMRDSDHKNKDTVAAEFIHHYEENRRLVENSENAHRVFKIALLLLSVMSTASGIWYTGRTRGGIAATVDVLKLCLAGVISEEQVDDLLQTMEDSRILLRDEAANGMIRLQLPFKSSVDDFVKKRQENEKTWTRYKMFAEGSGNSPDGPFGKAFRDRAWTKDDTLYGRMKLSVCCAETKSIDNAQETVCSDLEKYPYKLGLVIVTVSNEHQYRAIQQDLKKRAVESQQSRLTIALIRTPLTDEKRKRWLDCLTKKELAEQAGNSLSDQYQKECETIISVWVGEAVNGRMISWNGDHETPGQYGMANLRQTIQTQFRTDLFPYAPEVIASGPGTVYKPCNAKAPFAGIRKESDNAQFKSVLNALEREGLKDCASLNILCDARGSKAKEAVAALAKTIREKMESGQRVMLADLWEELQEAPFGYYNTVICGILLGFVFSFYKNSVFSWTDSAQGTHVLDEANLNKMITSICQSRLSMDFLSAGSIAFQHFREYVKPIFALQDSEVANETVCYQNMREAVTHAGSPLWVLKYLPEDQYGSQEFKETAVKIVDNMECFMSQSDGVKEAMNEVNQLFSGRGRLRNILAKAFQDRTSMASAFRTFLFQASKELEGITTRLAVQPVELSDKLHTLMPQAIYLWTETQVLEKLPDMVGEYQFLDALDMALGQDYRSIESAKRDIVNLFQHMRISLEAIEALNKSWFPALRIMYDLSQKQGPISREYLESSTPVLREYGKLAKDCLESDKAALGDILESDIPEIRQEEYTQEELDLIYIGLKDMNCDANLFQFKRALQEQINKIKAARNRKELESLWTSLSRTESVQSWSVTYGVPILWIIPNKALQRAISIVMDIQRGNPALNRSVEEAITELGKIDASLLTDSQKIEAAFLNVIGPEYREIFQQKRQEILSTAKFQIGSDMSVWTASDLGVLQRILKNELRKKAKAEKLALAKNRVGTMDETVLRKCVTTFLEEHPEYCDNFSG